MGHHYQETPGPDPATKKRKRQATLKLYVWEGVLTDYTDGIVVALAESKRKALTLVKAEDRAAWKHIKDLKPTLVKQPTAFVVWGGG